jgi:protein associated with RNAse G/E
MFLLFVTFLLSGCVKYNLDIKVSSDKKVDLVKATEFFERLKEFKKYRGQVVSFERDQERQERSYYTYFSLSLGRICRELAKESQKDMEQLYGQFHFSFSGL